MRPRSCHIPEGIYLPEKKENSDLVHVIEIWDNGPLEVPFKMHKDVCSVCHIAFGYEKPDEVSSKVKIKYNGRDFCWMHNRCYKVWQVTKKLTS